MSPENVELQHSDGEVERIDFTADRSKFKELVKELANYIESNTNHTDVLVMREGKRNPIIKSSSNDKVYAHYEGDGHYLSLRLADDEMVEATVNFMTSGGSTGSQREREREQHRSRERERRHPKEHTGESEVVREVGDKQRIFTPPYTKREVSYNEPTQTSGSDPNCRDCVHYIEGGGCKMVQGDIAPDANCDELYADFGIYGRRDNDGITFNLGVWGDRFDERMKGADLKGLSDTLVQAIRKRL